MSRNSHHLAVPIRLNQCREDDRFRFIDVIRGFAILGVIWHHTYYSHFAGANSAIDVFGQRVYPFVLNNGFLGVNLFFLVSGFVLFHPRMLRRFDVWPYYYKRALRLWPLYLFVLSCSFFLTRTPPVKAIKTSIVLLSGLHALIPSLWMPNVLWVLWSLGVEILFSLALPAIVFCCARFGVLKVAGFVLFACFCYRIVGDQVCFGRLPNYPNPLINPLKDNIFGRLDDFLVGICASYLYRRGVKPSFFLCLTAAIGALAAGYVWNLVYVADRTLWISTLASVGHPLFSVSAGVLLLGLLGHTVWNWSGFTPLVIFGQCCFSAYLVHAFILNHFRALFDFGNILSAASYLALTVLISLLLFSSIEVLGIGRKPQWWRYLWISAKRAW